MNMILIFVIVYMITSAWDVAHVNHLLEKMVQTGRTKDTSTPPIEPAPRLVMDQPTVSGERVV